MYNFPNCDLYLEKDNKKIAIVLGYMAKKISDNEYSIIIERVYPINFTFNLYDLNNFSLVVIKTNCTIRYEECYWDIGKSKNNNHSSINERMYLIAKKRIEKNENHTN